jgi:hypothetical protein
MTTAQRARHASSLHSPKLQRLLIPQLRYNLSQNENWSEAMQRLLAPSLREKSNALNVARIALAGLDDMISGRLPYSLQNSKTNK